jgi:hypothetical protein
MGLDDRDYMRRQDCPPRRPGSRPSRRSSFLGLEGGLLLGIVVVGIAFGGLIAKGFDRKEHPEPDGSFEDLADFDAFYFGSVTPVHVNQATREDLLLLPISESIADGIIARRPFKRTEELLEVRGIGEANFGIIRMYLYGFEDQPEPRPFRPPGIPDA